MHLPEGVCDKHMAMAFVYIFQNTILNVYVTNICHIT